MNSAENALEEGRTRASEAAFTGAATATVNPDITVAATNHRVQRTRELLNDFLSTKVHPLNRSLQGATLQTLLQTPSS